MQIKWRSYGDTITWWMWGKNQPAASRDGLVGICMQLYAYNINMYVYIKLPSSLEFERVVLPTENEKVKNNPSETFFQIKHGKNLGQSSSSWKFVRVRNRIASMSWRIHEENDHFAVCSVVLELLHFGLLALIVACLPKPTTGDLWVDGVKVGASTNKSVLLLRMLPVVLCDLTTSFHSFLHACLLSNGCTQSQIS